MQENVNSAMSLQDATIKQAADDSPKVAASAASINSELISANTDKDASNKQTKDEQNQKDRQANSKREQRVLAFSFVFCILLAILGLIFGIQSHSSAIVFDALISVVSSILTLFSIVAARFIYKEGTDGFQFGFAGLESMMNMLKAMVLIVICIYGFFDGFEGLLHGGSNTEHDDAFAFNITCFAIALGLFAYERYWAKKLSSALIAVDSLEWFSDIMLYLGSSLAFGLSVMFDPDGKQAWSSLVDPALLCVLSLVIVVAPVLVLIKNAGDLLLHAPRELSYAVDLIMERLCERHGFLDYRRRVSEQGRFYFLLLEILLDKSNDLSTSQVDVLRKEITKMIASKIKDEKELHIIISFTHERKRKEQD